VVWITSSCCGKGREDAYRLSTLAYRGNRYSTSVDAIVKPARGPGTFYKDTAQYELLQSLLQISHVVVSISFSQDGTCVPMSRIIRSVLADSIASCIWFRLVPERCHATRGIHLSTDPIHYVSRDLTSSLSSSFNRANYAASKLRKEELHCQSSKC